MLPDNAVYKQSFDFSPNSMLLVSYLNGVATVVDVNRSFTDFYGFSKAELLGNTPRLIKSGKQDAAYYHIMWASILDPKIGYWRDEIVNSRRDGSFINVILTVYSIFDNQSKPVWFIANHVDITKRVQAEQKISELNELMKLLNKILRHDLLNDLTVVKGDIQLFESGIDTTALADIPPAISRSMDLITQMRELESAVTSGKPLEPVRFSDVYQKTRDTFTDMELSLTGDATIQADAAFTSVIANLVRNAKMHGLTDHVDITVYPTDSAVEIRVADHGRGIPEAAKTQLFTEGFKYGDTGHTGLGLYIVKKTIERYGGRITVEDNVPIGAVFVIKLPLQNTLAGSPPLD
jgi:PAS domain S-box-containing protein